MCGIVTIFHKHANKPLDKDHISMFKQMLYADALRGWDSTGIATICNVDDKVQVLKSAGSAGQFFQRFPEHRWVFSNRALIGHNRWSTRGATNDENAHPFQEKHITLVHNGTLRSHRHMKNVDVDSHAICHHMAEIGAIPTLEKLDGAYALVWFDEESGHLYATRNKERTLYMVETNDLYILSSELGLAKWICERNAEHVKKEELLEPGVLYSFRVNKKNKLFINKTAYNMYVPPKIAPYHGPNQNEIGFSAPVVVNNVVNLHQQPTEDNNWLYDFQENEFVDLLALSRITMSYRVFGLGKHRWMCESFDDPNVMCEVYTDDDTDFTDSLITAQVNRKYWSPGLQKKVLVLSNPKHSLEKKTGDEETASFSTRNGIKLTKAVIKQCQDKYCETCTKDFEASTGIILEPVYGKHKHIYTYKYWCEDCADWREFQHQRGAMH